MKTYEVVLAAWVATALVSGCAVASYAEPQATDESELTLPIGWSSGVKDPQLMKDGTNATFAQANGRALMCPGSPEFVQTVRGGCRHLPSGVEFYAWAMVDGASRIGCSWNYSVTHSNGTTLYAAPSTAIFTSGDGASFRHEATVQSSTSVQTKADRRYFGWPPPARFSVLVVRTASTPWHQSPLRWYEVGVQPDSTACF